MTHLRCTPKQLGVLELKMGNSQNTDNFSITYGVEDVQDKKLWLFRFEKLGRLRRDYTTEAPDLKRLVTLEEGNFA